MWLALGHPGGILLHQSIAAQDIDYQLAAMVQPYKVNTRAAARGEIRYGNNYRGESELTRSSFKYRAQRYYSAIPRDIKCQSLATFKVKLKQYAAKSVPLR